MELVLHINNLIGDYSKIYYNILTSPIIIPLRNKPNIYPTKSFVCAQPSIFRHQWIEKVIYSIAFSCYRHLDKLF